MEAESGEMWDPERGDRGRRGGRIAIVVRRRNIAWRSDKGKEKLSENRVIGGRRDRSRRAADPWGLQTPSRRI